MTHAASPQLQLWSLDLENREGCFDGWLAELDDTERQQCLRFYHARDRLSYAAAHALLRRALASRLHCEPRTLSFQRSPEGRPLLSSPSNTDLDFNLSHTQGFVAVALCANGRVGVDVEALDRRSRFTPDDAQAYGLSQDEAEQLSEIPDSDQRNEAFLALWTAREAIAKADGRGLSLPLNTIRLNRSDSTAEIVASESEPATHWQLWTQRPTPRHVLTLACSKPFAWLECSVDLQGFTSILRSHEPAQSDQEPGSL